MGEPELQLLEQNVKNNVEDIREINKRVGFVERDVADLKADHQLTKQSISHVLQSLSELKTSFKSLDDKLDKDKEEQLKSYKKATWQVAIAIVVAVFLIQMGLK